MTSIGLVIQPRLLHAVRCPKRYFAFVSASAANPMNHDGIAAPPESRVVGPGTDVEIAARVAITGDAVETPRTTPHEPHWVCRGSSFGSLIRVDFYQRRGALSVVVPRTIFRKRSETDTSECRRDHAGSVRGRLGSSAESIVS